MALSRKRTFIDSDGDSSDGDDLEQQLLSLSKKSKQSIAASAPSSVVNDNASNKDDSDTSTDNSDGEWTLEADSKSKVKKKKKSKSVEKRRTSAVSEEDGEIRDDELEDGEVSSSSSSDDEGSDEDLPAFDDGLDDDLIGDDSDRLRLEQMTEKEREQELFNRMEKREAMKTRLEIEHKLHSERKKERKIKKEHHKEGNTKSSGYHNSIATRKGERKKNLEDKKVKAMDELKQKRIEKKEKLESMSKKEPLNTKDVYSDDDDEEEDSEKNEDADTDKSSVEFATDDEDQSQQDKPIEQREQLEKIRLSRHKLERWVHLPFFPRVATGCFVRMGIGNHEGRAIYRVAEIIGVTETPKVYNLGNTRTNKGLKVRHGLQERVFRMEYVSNQTFTDSEFQKWKEEMALVELPLPNISHVDQKLTDISESKVYNFKDDDIEAIVNEKNRFRKNPYNYAVKKNNLLRQKEIAEQEGDMLEFERVKEKLDDLEERAEMLDRQRSGALSNVSFINERNRKKNVYDAEKACMEEGRLNKFQNDNPFTRRKTLPVMVMKSGSSHGDKKNAEKTGTSSEDANETQLVTRQEEGKALPSSLHNTPSQSSAKSEESDMFSAHDFDVQIDVAMPATRTISLTPKPITSQKENFPRRSLNLDEYKKRKGLM